MNADASSNYNFAVEYLESKSFSFHDFGAWGLTDESAWEILLRYSSINSEEVQVSLRFWSDIHLYTDSSVCFLTNEASIKTVLDVLIFAIKMGDKERYFDQYSDE